MKKLLFATLAMFFVTFESFAQVEQGVFSIKPAAGITIANLTGSGASSKIGFTGGAELAYQATDILGLSAGVMYSMEGAKDDIHTEVGRYDAKVNLSYLNIPVMANFYVFDNLALKIGIQPACLLKAEAKLGSSTTNIKSQVEKFNFSIPVGISYEFGNLMIDARFAMGLTKVTKKTAEVNDAKSSVFQITLGYRIPLR